MINHEIAQVLLNMSYYLQMEPDNKSFFRARALKNASEVIEKFPYDLSEPEWYGNSEKLIAIEGIGESTAKHIQDYVHTGSVPEYEEMKKKSPVKLEEMIEIQGIGPKTILKLYKELGVKDLESLKQAALKNKIANLEGFGAKSQQKILDSISLSIKNKERHLYFEVEEILEKLIKFLTEDINLIKVVPVGSYRRKTETIGDIDILVTTSNPKATMEHFVKFPLIEKVIGSGETKGSVWLKQKIQVDLRVLKNEVFGAGMQYFTGNKEHNIKVRNIAIQKGYKLSEYGLFERNDENNLIESENEEKIYKLLGLDYIEPELREDMGEIEAAKTNNLPKIINLKSIKGDLHIHTKYSDGTGTIEEMVEKGISLGYEYMGISDHLGNLKVAGAIDETEFGEYLESIERCKEKYRKKIKIYTSGEVDINKEGDLVFNQKLLEKLDYVIAAVHYGFTLSPDLMTRRILNALNNPVVKILAHPTGRLLTKREGFEFDYDEVFRKSASKGIAIEINSQPTRLDLEPKLAKLSHKLGCKLTVNTDAHSINEMDFMKYGVNIARKAWVEKKNLKEF